jgi:hypothetical protein
MDASEKHVFKQNMFKLKHSLEEQALAEFGNLEKERNLLREEKK